MLIVGLLLAAIVVVWWWSAPREYAGVLVFHPHLVGIPEFPPPVATLRLPDGTQYWLEVRPSMRDELRRFDGKSVRVRSASMCGTLA